MPKVQKRQLPSLSSLVVLVIEFSKLFDHNFTGDSASLTWPCKFRFLTDGKDIDVKDR